ncbi:MAG: hypothetical protein ACC707_19840 [Thiohalomonadales bacterium]
MLAPGGVLICIEPAIEFQSLWKSATRKEDASPTGGDVTYFDMPQLEKHFSTLPDLTIFKKKSIHLLPGLINIHHAISVVKQLSNNQQF